MSEGPKAEQEKKGLQGNKNEGEGRGGAMWKNRERGLAGPALEEHHAGDGGEGEGVAAQAGLVE